MLHYQKTEISWECETVTKTMNPATKMFRDGRPSWNNPHESNATKIEFSWEW